MTSQSPRIYLYKITFEEVPYYYYGIKKEKYYNQEYWGSPYTHKWIWEFYTPKKQILELFDYSDDGYIEAQRIEKRIIKPLYNIDKWCLNENCGGIISLEINRKTGKIMGLKHKENKTGVCGRSKEKMIEDGKRGGSISGKKTYECKLGIHSLDLKQRVDNARKGGEKVSSQKWKCTETGYVSNAGALTKYQRVRGIDTSKRVRLS